MTKLGLSRGAVLGSVAPFATLALITVASCSSSSEGGGGGSSSGSSGSSSGSSGSSGSSSGSSGSSGDGGKDAPAGTCLLPEVAGAAGITPTFTFYEPAANPPVVPTAMTGGSIGGKYKITAAKIFLPTGTKGLADPAKSKGTVTGWAVFQGKEYRIKLDVDVTISSILGDQPQKNTTVGQGTFTASGSSLTFDPTVCDPNAETPTGVYSYTAGATTKIVVKTTTPQFGDTFVEADAEKVP